MVERYLDGTLPGGGGGKREVGAALRGQGTGVRGQGSGVIGQGGASVRWRQRSRVRGQG